ncbi:tyrosine-type recombinase/integrase [Dactylosporangium fulvum]|uniref:Tyrosine-type recombinase/integrase n=2 Tax=Dactylosporangium fulvum TaxID=53359 RepID=A0ABY5W4B9_9ACTN|nr:tyrosine-type recombinase/integrase [Dactylosporangium fulvum]UWP83926.1 tyrosine-type recombinase/integrase [Dactylosporangium fulvum]
METTYDVRIWKTTVYEGKRGSTYYVRWTVAGRQWKEPFKGSALAEGFRSDLVAASRKGEAFDIESGLPVSMRRASREMSWYQFACAFVDMKWPRVAATTRRTHAEALTAVTTSMFTTERGKPDDKLIRLALSRWGFNTVRRNAESCPAEVKAALRWIENHTRQVSTLGKPEVLRPMLDGLTVRLDGKPAAPSVVSRRRKILNTSVEYAVELKLLPANPIPALKWTPPRTTHAVDRRSVANPVQVRSLLDSVREQKRSGPRFVAFFGCLYFAAMRPEEAVALAKHHLVLPAEGWGEFNLNVAEPHAGKEWTDSGENRDRRQLKQRARGEVRTVPCPPELTALLNWHIGEFGTAPDGRLFTGERNEGELPRGTINRMWRRARKATFTPEVVASPLAASPYDLRHAAVSTWLNGGIPATQVAEWAGHSVEVLLKIYAKCLDGGGQELRRRMTAALGH